MNADQNGKRIRREPRHGNLAIGFDVFGSNNRVRRCCGTHAQSLIMKGGYASLAGIMHYAALFCTSGELARADIPSGEIGVRQLVMQRVRG
jgi:hypothetical protein